MQPELKLNPCNVPRIGHIVSFSIVKQQMLRPPSSSLRTYKALSGDVQNDVKTIKLTDNNTLFTHQLSQRAPICHILSIGISYLG